MTYNPIKFFKKSEKVRALIVGKNASSWRFGYLQKEGDFLKDFPKEKAYGPLRNHRPFFDEKGKATYIFHEETGAPLEAKITGDVLEMRTDPTLMYRLVDKEMLANALNLQPSYILVVLTLLLGFFVGISIGMSL